jgi:hypothetical protein
MESAKISDILTLHVWLALTTCAVMLLLPIVVWAIRSGQFGSQKRAARLPLEQGRRRDREVTDEA